MADEALDWSEVATEDIQHDLAMTLADIPKLRDEAWIAGEMDFAEGMRRELVKRNAPLPVACAWVFDPYARGRMRLTYQLEESQ